MRSSGISSRGTERHLLGESANGLVSVFQLSTATPWYAHHLPALPSLPPISPLAIPDLLLQIKFLQSKISIAFRTRLTRYIHDLYLNDKQAYYKLQNLDGGLVGGGADQFITSDLPLFCDSAAALYSSLGKPFLDLVVFNYQLMRSLGPLALAGILFNYGATAWMLKKFSPPFGRLAAAQGRREGEFRGLHSKWELRN